MRIKTVCIILLLCVAHRITAQSINQFDANGKRHGLWQKKYKNSTILRYKGHFFHGKEIDSFLFYKNKNNKAHLYILKLYAKTHDTAQVTFFNANDKILSKGKMLGKKYIGEWLYYQEQTQKLITKEHYNTNGKLDGVRSVYYKNETLAELSNYANGKLHGVSKWFQENGKIMRIITYKNNLLEGPFFSYDLLGQPLIIGQYKNDKKDGIWTYYKQGKKVKEINFTKAFKINN